MKKSKLFLLFFLSAAFVFPCMASAQGVEIPSSGNFSVDISPRFPGPFQEVTASAVSNVFNMNGSLVTWAVNGKTQLRGVGEKKFTFITGEVGLPISISVEVSTEDFGLLTKVIEIRPSDVDILWEADTYTPPFYKGKALPTSQSYIKAVGLPNFIAKSGKVPAKDLVYSWKKAYVSDPNNSGIGKNIYFYRGTYTFNSNVIETSVSTPDGTLSLKKQTVIPIYEPKIIFYERKPLEGIRYENALGGTFSIKESEVTLRAEPYFFSFLNADNNGAVFSWRLDGKKLEINPDKKAEFTLRKPAGGSGHADISLEIKNSGYDLQTTKKNINLLYTN